MFCDDTFWGRLSLLSLSQFPEGNTLAATEFVRLLEVSGSVTAKRSNGKAENTQLLGSNRSFNPTRTQDVTQNTCNQCGTVVFGVPPPGV